jgi:hypothetical protein
MTDSKRLITKNITMGDAAVDGLCSGVIAGVVMAAYLVMVGLVVGEASGLVLGRFDPNETSPLAGLLMHLAIASVYGALFGLMGWLTTRIRPFGRLPGWLAGLAYGLTLLLLARAVILPGVASPLLEISTVHFTLAHVIYGLVLGLLFNRQDKI